MSTRHTESSTATTHLRAVEPTEAAQDGSTAAAPAAQALPGRTERAGQHFSPTVSTVLYRVGSVAGWILLVMASYVVLAAVATTGIPLLSAAFARQVGLSGQTDIRAVIGMWVLPLLFVVGLLVWGFARALSWVFRAARHYQVRARRAFVGH